MRRVQSSAKPPTNIDHISSSNQNIPYQLAPPFFVAHDVSRPPIMAWRWQSISTWPADDQAFLVDIQTYSLNFALCACCPAFLFFFGHNWTLKNLLDTVPFLLASTPLFWTSWWFAGPETLNSADQETGGHHWWHTNIRESIKKQFSLR